MRASGGELEWLDRARDQVSAGQLPDAEATLRQALRTYPESLDVTRALSGVLQMAGRNAEAEALLRPLLAEHPGDVSSAFALARLLHGEGRNAGAAAVLRACMDVPANARNVNRAIAAIELLDDCGRIADAAHVADVALAATPDEARLHAYAGMLGVQLGAFAESRVHYLFAIAHDRRAFEWNAAVGLASTLRYASTEHPDLALFRDALQRQDLSEAARAELHFALGKALDDAGEFADAATHFRAGNAIAHRLGAWSAKRWRRAISARLTASAKPAGPTTAHAAAPDFIPVFVVGMPRTGTTLLAELLSRRSGVCNRGELKCLGVLGERPEFAGAPDRAALRQAAADYLAQSRQDDGGDARWFVDKNPLNFRYLDLALGMFPEARVLYCRRGARDTALSLWSQSFREAIQAYACDFSDIATVMRSCTRLMQHWRTRFPASIREVWYEDLARSPGPVVDGIAAWLGLPRADAAPNPAPAAPASSISTASLWQARQPVYTRSIGRWQHYAQHLPELQQFDLR